MVEEEASLWRCRVSARVRPGVGLQLVLKWWVLGLFFGTAMPILYPLLAGFFALSLRVDRYNLLRGMLPPPQAKHADHVLCDPDSHVHVMHIWPRRPCNHFDAPRIRYAA